MIVLFPRRGEAGFSPNINFLATPVHDVIDIKCIKNTYLNQKCTIIVVCYYSAMPQTLFRASGQRTTYAPPSDQ